MKTNPMRTRRPILAGRAGFTLLELVVVLGVLAVSAALLAPALARTKLDSRAFRCLNNARQVALAIQMYQADHQDFFPPNPDDGNSTRGHNWCTGLAGASDAKEFNPDALQDAGYTLIAPYARTNAEIFRCPADARRGLYTGTDPAKLGKVVAAARSISMNLAVGTICAGFDAGSGHSGPPTLAVNGSWLDGAHAHRRDSPYQTFGKASSFTRLRPAGVWLTMDEDADSLNDANFSFAMNTAQWIDWPGTYHAMAATLSFADGHAEFHRWQDFRTKVVNHAVARLMVPGSVDWQWLAARTSFRAQ